MLWSVLAGAITVLVCRHVGIMYIKSDLTFKIEPIPLHSVRPFIIEGIRLKGTGIHPQDDDGVEEYLAQKVADMVDRAAAESEGNDKLPLVRLKVRRTYGYIPSRNNVIVLNP